VLGGLFALTTVIVHSFVEFGMHLPAITCLVTVLCAQLAGLGDTARGQPAPGDASPEDAHRLASMPQLGGLIPVLAAVTGVLLAVALHLEGKRADYAERFRLAAFRAMGDDNIGHQIAALQSAVKIASGNATLHEDLAKASFAALPSSARSAPFDQLPDADRMHLLQAARHWLIARDLCPLLAEPQAWRAANASRLATGDDLQSYLQRALRIRPFDPELWYIKGLYAMERDQQDEALRCWKKSLEFPRQDPGQMCRQIRGQASVPGATARRSATALRHGRQARRQDGLVHHGAPARVGACPATTRSDPRSA